MVSTEESQTQVPENDKGFRLRLIWDIFMSLVAVVNLSLILFDLTYLWLRPYYFQYLPQAVAMYDPVKGIQKHRSTEKYLDLVDKLERLYRKEGKLTPQVRELLAQLIQKSKNMIDENPFQRSGQTGKLERIKRRMQTYIHKHNDIHHESYKDAFASFWYMREGNVMDRLKFFNEEIRPLMEVNYFRHRSVTGGFVDHFWKYDLPFLILFAIEFAVRWILAIKRRTYLRWFIFPLYNWYDLLGLIPAKEFRIFRMFRIVSIYMRLKRSSITNVGEDIISRTVHRYSNIIAEEISDMVAIKILTEVQDEIKQGSSMNIVSTAIEPKKEEIKALLVQKIEVITHRRLLPLKPSVKELIGVSLTQSLSGPSSPLHQVPLPNSMLKPLFYQIGELFVDVLFATMEDTVDSADGKKAISDVIDEAFEITIAEMTARTMDELVQEVLLEALENVKQRVAVKKWAEE